MPAPEPRAAPAPVVIPAPVPGAAPAPSAVAVPDPVEVPGVIYFDPDAYTIKPEYRKLLAEHAKRLKSDPGQRLEVRGHTDSDGPLDYNLALSNKRVEMVIRMLVSLGVDERQLEPRAYADRLPAAHGDDAESWARNRRVELVYR